MRELLLVLMRELNERVRTRSFALGTLLFPLFLVAVLLLPSLGGGPEDRRLVVIDEAPGQIAETFALALNRASVPALDTLAPRPAGATTRWHVDIVPGPLEPLRDDLMARSAAEEIDGYVVFPTDVRESARVQFRSARVADPGMLREIRVAATEAVQADRLARAGVRLDLVMAAFRPVRLDDGRVARDGGEAGTARASLFLAYFVALIVYMLIALYGTAVTRSVLEEKNNRIAELLVSSMRAEHLIAGKIFGVGAAVLLQMLSWVVVIGVIVSQSEWVARQLNIDPAALSVITAQPATTLLLVAYAILGFLFFAALFAGLGAAVASDQEAQSLQMLFMLPLFVPLLFLLQLTTQPLEPLARTLGLVPFTAPVAMPMRMAAARVPAGDIALSLVLLALAIIVAAWAAAKIYRLGILTTGRRAHLREILHGLRAR